MAKSRLMRSQLKGLVVQVFIVCLLFFRPTWISVLVVLIIIGYCTSQGKRRSICVHGGGLPLFEGSMVTTIYERNPTIFMPHPDGIAVQWDGFVAEQSRKRVPRGAKPDLIRLGQCRLLKLDDGEWRLQLAQVKRATYRDGHRNTDWVTWYHWPAPEQPLGAVDEQPSATVAKLPPLTTGKDGTRWERTLPASMYIGGKSLPLFVGLQREAAQASLDGTTDKHGNNKKLAKKVSKGR